jgi:hypothetical protein
MKNVALLSKNAIAMENQIAGKRETSRRAGFGVDFCRGTGDNIGNRAFLEGVFLMKEAL